jgi:hypothetical protein
MSVIRQGQHDLSSESLSLLIECFEEFKAETDKKILSPQNIFVETQAYKTIIDRTKKRINTILLGRKGDGKTALLKRLEYENDQKNQNDNSSKSIFFQFNMEDAYFQELILQVHQIVKDIKRKYKNIDAEQVSKKIWIKFLIITSVQIVINTPIEDEIVKKISDDNFASIKNAITDELSVDKECLRLLDIAPNFLFYLEKIYNTLTSNDKFLAEGAISRNPQVIFRELPDIFSRTVSKINNSDINVTIALDRFDDFIDSLISNDIDSTRMLRRQFLHGLIAAMYDLQKRAEFGWLRIVASLPHDLVVDINFREQASVSKMLFVEIEWSIKDLKMIINNRIASVIPNATFDSLFPFQISNKNPIVKSKEHADDYIIRHTMRRPREIMAHCLALFREITRSNRKISSKDFNKIVSNTNREIIQSHVIPEWQAVINNIEPFIHGLSRKNNINTIFNFGEFVRWNDNISLVNTQSEVADIKSINNLSVLYRIGVVGFRVKAATATDGYMRQGESDFAKYIFSYSKNKEPLVDITKFLMSDKIGFSSNLDMIKSIIGILSNESSEINKHEYCLCLSPVVFESVEAVHTKPYIINQIWKNTE